MRRESLPVALTISAILGLSHIGEVGVDDPRRDVRDSDGEQRHVHALGRSSGCGWTGGHRAPRDRGFDGEDLAAVEAR